MSVIGTLITNREAGTFYNFTDVNRVNEAIMYVAQLLTEAGYPTIIDPLPTNWAMGSIYYVEDAKKVTSALDYVKKQFNAARASKYPSSFQNLTFEGANQIEQFLKDTDTLLAMAKQEWLMRQCGTVQTGGELLR